MLIDTHCHLNFDCFNHDYQQLLLQLLAHNINHIIVPGTDAKRWGDIIQLASHNKMVHYALGIHPHFLTSFTDQDLVQLKKTLLAVTAKTPHQCVALGEIGLDKLIACDMTFQENVFIAQLKIAISLKLPIILHVVKTQSRVLQLLKQLKFPYGGIYHAFSGSEEIALEFIKLGFKLGIGGVITYPNATKTRATLSKLPLESLVLETDAPDMPIYQQSGLYNSPLNLITIFKSLCNIRDESPEIVAEQLYDNSKSIFPIIND